MCPDKLVTTEENHRGEPQKRTTEETVNCSVAGMTATSVVLHAV